MSLSQLRIQRARPQDVPELLPLVADYWRFENIEHYSAQRVAEQLERLLSTPQMGAGWLARKGTDAIGYLLAVYVFSLEHLGVTAEIDEFYIAPNLRGQGIGAALLEIAETEFRQAGYTNVSLQLAKQNKRARGFYHRRGYGERAAYELLDKMLPSIK